MNGEEHVQRFEPVVETHSGSSEVPIYVRWCQGRRSDGNICGELFRWTPLYLQLCPAHRDHLDPHAPCYFLKLPTELRQEVFKYLMPDRAIDSLIVYENTEPHPRPGAGILRSSLRTVFPTPLLCLYLGFNREVYEEVKDVFYKAATFTIDVSRDGVMLCGRRILGPRGRDGSNYYIEQRNKDRFMRDFAWASIRNYDVSISIERRFPRSMEEWDEEVELYDIRDFTAVVVSGVLAKARPLCNLQVRIYLKDFDWSLPQVLSNTKLIAGPFERLRCVRQPRLVGVFCGNGSSELYAQRHRPCNSTSNRCVTPSVPDPWPLLGPGMTAGFDAFAADWERRLALDAPANILSKSPMTRLFTELRAFHNRLAETMPTIVQRGRHCYLHRARVAREHEDILSFRAVGAELVQHWHDRLALQEREKKEINTFLHRMIDADIYLRDDRDGSAVGKAQKQSVVIDLT